MNRRSFFSSLAVLAGAASLSPNIFIPKFEPVIWKRSPRRIVNPKWILAEYKCVIISGTPVYDERIIFHRRESEDPSPLIQSRYSLLQVPNEFGEWKLETP